MSIRLGLIGVGRWGKRYIQTLRDIKDARLTHLCTRHPENAGLVGHPVEVTNDWRAMCRAPGLDGVIIATPPSTHPEILHACFDAKLPALVEKPLCLSLDEARKLQQYAKESGSLVLVDHTHVFHPAFEAIRKQFQDPRAIHLIHSEGEAYGPFRTNDASVLWDWAPHDVALCLELLGKMPVSVVCLGTATRESRPLDSGLLVLKLEFENDTVAWINIGHLSTQKRRRFSIFADERVVVFDDQAQDKLVEHSNSWHQRFEAAHGGLNEGRAIPFAPGLPLTRVVTEFVQGISGHPSARFGVKLAVDVIRVIDAAQVSLQESSRRVDLSQPS